MPNPIIFNASGDAVTGAGVGEKLLAANFDVGALRPFIHNDRAYITVNGKGRPATNNATLTRDEWKQYDDTILKAFQSDLTFVKGLKAAGLTYNLPNPLGKTILEHQNMSNAIQAKISMDANVQDSGDTPEIGTGSIPIPIISSGFNIDLRTLASSRNSQVPLDTTNQEFAARANAVFLENQTLFGNGGITEAEKLTLNFSSSAVRLANRYTFGTQSIDGVFTSEDAVEYQLGYDWLLAATTGKQIVQDVINMKQELAEQGYGGDAKLSLPSYLSARLSEDYKSAESSSVMTILNRIEMIQGITVDFVESLGRITAADTQYINVCMIAMRTDVIRIIDGFDSMLVQWDSQGGMNTNYRILTIQVPQIRTRQAGDCGIVRGYRLRAL